MPGKSSLVIRAEVSDGLEVHVAAFLATLPALGYAEKTQHDKRRGLAPFIRWMRDSRIAIAALNETYVARFIARRRFYRKHRAPAALRQFLEYLRVVGIVPRRCVEDSGGEVLVRNYLDHLRDGQGLCQRSLEIYGPYVRSFVAVLRLPARIGSLDALSVRGYLLEQSRHRSVAYVKLVRAALRSFLRFCFLEGLTAGDLSTAMPQVRRWQYAAVPPCLSAEEVEQVIAAAERSTARGARAFAVLLLLARLGLRAGEIVTLELEDIRWDAGELLVRGKGRLHDRVPLPRDVGTALALYLRKARPLSSSRRVFLRRIAPHVALSGPTAVCVIAREALRHAGLRPAGRVGAHIFRHSLATRMARGGASLGEIAQLLRHRSISTTQLYARADIEALRAVALAWPVAEGLQ